MKIPKNSTIIRTMAVSKDSLVMVVKSKCRHYSALTFQLKETDEGDALVLVDKATRCGITGCGAKMF